MGIPIKQNQSQSLTINIKGNIDESTDFSKLLGSLENQEITIVCDQVKKINSTGVKAWISFFQDFNKKNKVKFSKMSIVLVEQLNSVMNFACGAEIESVMVPFVCKDCGKESCHLIDTGYLKKMTSVADAVCPHCQGHSEFDDLPEEYFSFLEFN